MGISRDLILSHCTSIHMDEYWIDEYISDVLFYSVCKVDQYHD